MQPVQVMDEDDIIETPNARKQISNSDANQSQIMTPIITSVANDQGVSARYDDYSADRNLIFKNETDLKYERKNSNENAVELT